MLGKPYYCKQYSNVKQPLSLDKLISETNGANLIYHNMSSSFCKGRQLLLDSKFLGNSIFAFYYACMHNWLIDYLLINVFTGMSTCTIRQFQCKVCGWLPFAKPHDLVQIAVWPADFHGNLYIEFEYMYHLSVSQHFCPEYSLGAMLQTAKFMTSVNSCVSKLRCYYCHYFYWCWHKAYHHK